MILVHPFVLIISADWRGPFEFAGTFETLEEAKAEATRLCDALRAHQTRKKSQVPCYEVFDLRKRP